MTRLDNVTLGARIFRRIVEHSGWEACCGCKINKACPLMLNHCAIRDMGGIVEDRVRWVYRRLTAYEQRLTLREMLAHLAYSLTGGMTCEAAQEMVNTSTESGADRGTAGLEKILFSETFFGYCKGLNSEEAGSLRAVELLRRQVFGGPIGVDFARQLGRGHGSHWAQLPVSLNPLSRHWANLAGESVGVRWRFAQRRMFYLFGQPKPGFEEVGEIFLDTFLQSPRLRDFDHWIREGSLTLTLAEKQRLRNACLNVLLERYSGFNPGQFTQEKNQLYLTLRRPDRAVFQPAQLIKAVIDFREFELRFDAERRILLLVFARNSKVLTLTLPLLDYIENRHAGDLGCELAQIHIGQLESFRADLLGSSNIGIDAHEIQILRADINGDVGLHRYILDREKNLLEAF